ncbi:MAG: molecular chaperone GroEL [Blautia sp.]|nr:molecular chaperone GroEL [Blautia sp.]MDD7729726.1 molecular chaperone GroEL [Clostridia bacterium]MDY5665135.1 molecular chaperone GroEL [Blautia sp.]
MASYVSPNIRDKFETLSIELKNEILSRNVQLNNMQDLITVLEKIVNEAGE